MTFKVKLAAAGVLALAAGGTGAALASGGHASGTPAAAAGTRVSAAAWGARVPGLLGGRFGLDAGLQAAADYLGIPVATLKSDLQAGKTLAQIADGTSGKSASGLIQALVAKAKSGLDKAVADGKLTQVQADTIATRLQQLLTALVNHTLPARPATPKPFPLPGFRLGFGLGASLQTAADYLGIPLATLKSDLQAGKTLAQIADGTKGKSANGLVQTLVAKAKSGLDKAVADGKLTQAQADAVSANLQQRITNLVNGTRPTLRPFSGPRGFGFGFGGRHTNRSAPPAQGTTT